MRSLGRILWETPTPRPALLTELSPPASADLGAFVEQAQPLSDVFDAVQLTDMPMARVHMDNLAAAARLTDHGFELVVNITCRDRNVLGMQGKLLAAAALGVRNVFCLSGDPPALGDHPTARGVYELDALEWLALARRLRDEGVLASGRRLEVPPRVTLGAAAAPASPGPDGHPSRIRAKLAAGADFFITQPIFDVPAFARFAAAVSESGGARPPTWVAGISALRDPAMAAAMADMPGMHIPDAYVDALRRTAPAERECTAWALAEERALALLELPGVRGIMIYPLADLPHQLAERAAGLSIPRP